MASAMALVHVPQPPASLRRGAIHSCRPLSCQSMVASSPSVTIKAQRSLCLSFTNSRQSTLSIKHHGGQAGNRQTFCPCGMHTPGFPGRRAKRKRGTTSVVSEWAEASTVTSPAAGGPETAVPPRAASENSSVDPFAEAKSRLQCLEVLVLLRHLYRDVVRSERILEASIPRVADPGESESDGSSPAKRKRVRDWVKQIVKKKVVEDVVLGSSMELVEYAQDIRELGLSLRRDLSNLEGVMSLVFQEGRKAEAAILETVVSISDRLDELAQRVEGSLSPEERERALAECTRMQAEELAENMQAKMLRRLESISSTSEVLARVRTRFSSVDLNTVKTNLSSVDLDTIQRRFKRVVEALAATWRRLNGRAEVMVESAVTVGLPRPPSVRDSMEGKKLALILEVEALDKKLGEISRARESRLRASNILARTRLASEVRSMDDEVNELRKKLAVRTMQLEMTVIFMCLWEDLMLIAEDVRSEEEENLVVAEFGLLDADLAKLRAAVDRNEATLIQDEELEMLATEIPELKLRLGIPQASSSIPLQQRLQMTLAESWMKVKDGASFFWRGLRLLAGDLSYSGRLFWVAITGTTLKPREVQTLRRTARDLVTLVPFTIILIAPITPVGHVMVFSFLQRYFPGFFPTAFSSKRQRLMVKYDTIREQMRLAVTEREKEDAAAAAKVVATEAFEVSEEEEQSPREGGGTDPTKGTNGVKRSSTDGPEGRRRRRTALVLNDALPQMARRISNLRSEQAAESIVLGGTGGSVGSGGSLVIGGGEEDGGIDGVGRSLRSGASGQENGRSGNGKGSRDGPRETGLHEESSGSDS